MEVHAHTHTARKKWTHYFWEFLMLFLAVFCGFLAENQREHMIERQRGKQYMESLLSDLSADTAMLNTGIARKEGRINAIDSVFVFFQNNKNVLSISGSLFKILRRTTYDQRLIRSSITINQLKNAGGMRLIRKKDVTDSISQYDVNCERYDFYNEYYLTHGQLNLRSLEKMISADDMLQFYITNNTEAVVTNIPDSLQIPVNTEALNEYLNLLMQIKLYARQEINRINRLKNNAANLMALIQKKYSIK